MLWIAYNDIDRVTAIDYGTSTMQNLSKLWQEAREAGFHVVAFTIHHSTAMVDLKELKRQELNAWIKANADRYDVLVDIDQIFYDTIGPNYASDASYFSDGVHPTDLCSTLIANSVDAAITAASLSSPRPWKYPIPQNHALTNSLSSFGRSGWSTTNGNPWTWGNVGIGTNTTGKPLYLLSGMNGPAQVVFDNPDAGALAEFDLLFNNDSGTKGELSLFGTAKVSSGPKRADGMMLESLGTGGLNLFAAYGGTGGAIRMFTGGSYEPHAMVDLNGNFGVGTNCESASSTFHNFGSEAHSIVTGAGRTLGDTNEVYLLNNTGDTVTLPTAVGHSGRVYTIELVSPATSGTVATTGAETINGASTYALSSSNQVLSVISDNVNWRDINNNAGSASGNWTASGTTNSVLGGNATVNYQMGYAGLTVAQLASLNGIGAGYQTYCTDCLTPWGIGDRVEWDATSSSWRTLRSRIAVASSVTNFVLNALSAAVNVNTPVSDIIFGALTGVAAESFPTRTHASSGTGASYGAYGTSALGTYQQLTTGTTTTGNSRSVGPLLYQLQSGDWYSCGGTYFVSSTPPDGTDNWWCEVGVDSQAGGGYPVTGAFFLYDFWNTNNHGQSYSNHWICVSCKSSTYAYADSGLAPATTTTTPDKLALMVTTTNVFFFTNGVQCASITTAGALPVSTAMYASKCMITKTNAGVSSRLIGEIYPWMNVRRATARTY